MKESSNFGVSDAEIDSQYETEQLETEFANPENEVESDDFDDTGIPDFSVFRVSQSKPLESLLPDSLYGLGGESKLPLGKKVQTYIQAFSRMPDGVTQYPLLASAVLQPSGMAESQLPIIAFFGNSGCGKSEMIKLFSYLRKLPIEDGTNASIRDAISFGKYKKKGMGRKDDHYLLLTDNAGQDDLWRNPDFYRLLLKGYDRDTSRLSISGGKDNDQPLYFDCFCMKVISSIFPLDNDERFLELRRRLLIFRFEKDYKAKPLNPKAYDFTPIQDEIRRYWRNKPNLMRYRDNAILVRSRSSRIIDEIGDENFYLLVELIVTALTTGITETIEEFVSLLKHQIEVNGKREKSDLEVYVTDWLFKDDRWLPTVPQGNLQNLLIAGVKEGSLEPQAIKVQFVRAVMQRLGYTKVKGKWCLGIAKK